MQFHNDRARYAYEQKRRASSPEYAAQELAALRERVPEQLPQRYAIISVSEKGVESRVCSGDRLSLLWTHSGFGLDTTRRMIDTGKPVKVFGGWRKIVPDNEPAADAAEDPAVSMFLALGRAAN